MTATTVVYLVRHGQTEWNVQRRFQGFQDSPLTELGVRQAEWLGEALANERIDRIYASSSARALRTADIIRGKRDIELSDSDDLKEINLGVWEGITQDEAKLSDPLAFDRFWNDPERFRVRDGETFPDVEKRAVGMLIRIIRDNVGKSVMIVSHTVVVKLLMAYFEKRPMRDIWQPPYIHPACLCKVEVTGDRHHIILHADIGHYQAEPLES